MFEGKLRKIDFEEFVDVESFPWKFDKVSRLQLTSFSILVDIHFNLIFLIEVELM